MYLAEHYECISYHEMTAIQWFNDISPGPHLANCGPWEQWIKKNTGL